MTKLQKGLERLANKYPSKPFNLKELPQIRFTFNETDKLREYLKNKEAKK